MKHFTFFLFILFTTSFFSCEKDKTNPEIKNETSQQEFARQEFQLFYVKLVSDTITVTYQDAITIMESYLDADTIYIRNQNECDNFITKYPVTVQWHFETLPNGMEKIWFDPEVIIGADCGGIEPSSICGNAYQDMKVYSNDYNSPCNISTFQFTAGNGSGFPGNYDIAKVHLSIFLPTFNCLVDPPC